MKRFEHQNSVQKERKFQRGSEKAAARECCRAASLWKRSHAESRCGCSNIAACLVTGKVNLKPEKSDW